MSIVAATVAGEVKNMDLGGFEVTCWRGSEMGEISSHHVCWAEKPCRPGLLGCSDDFGYFHGFTSYENSARFIMFYFACFFCHLSLVSCVCSLLLQSTFFGASYCFIANAVLVISCDGT